VFQDVDRKICENRNGESYFFTMDVPDRSQSVWIQKPRALYVMIYVLNSSPLHGCMVIDYKLK